MKNLIAVMVTVIALAVTAGVSHSADATSIKPWQNLKSKNVPYEQPAQDEVLFTGVSNGTFTVGANGEIPARGTMSVELWGAGKNGTDATKNLMNCSDNEPGTNGHGGGYLNVDLDIKNQSVAECEYLINLTVAQLLCKDQNDTVKFIVGASNSFSPVYYNDGNGVIWDGVTVRYAGDWDGQLSGFVNAPVSIKNNIYSRSVTFGTGGDKGSYREQADGSCKHTLPTNGQTGAIRIKYIRAN